MSANYLTTNKPYLSALEGWRGIVSCFVMMFHFYIFFADTLFIPYAYMGVDFFFILSGFIISRQYEAGIATRGVSFMKFAIRRLGRLYPLYIFSIVMFVAVNHFYIVPTNPKEEMIHIGMGPDLVWQLLLQLTMLGNIGGMVMPWNGPAWSVSVEWIVNLGFFFLAWKLRRIPALLWAAIAIFCAIYLIDYSPQHLNLIMADQPFFNPTLARGFLGFALGALIFRFHHSLPKLSWFTLHMLDALLIIATMILIAYYDSEFVVGIDYLFLFILFPQFIILSLYRASWVGRIASLPPFTFLGKISYSIYLLHLPLGYFYMYSPFFQQLNLTRPMFGLVYIALVLLVSILTYYFLETPFRLLSRRFSRNI